MSDIENSAFKELYAVIQKLRAKDGCPWDKEQTVDSLRTSLLEEVYECIEAINSKDAMHVKEELGDSIFVAMMIASIYEEQNIFTLSEAISECTQKLKRRHPHVFGDAVAKTPEEVVLQWNKIKETQEGRAKKDSVLDKVSKALPPIERAYKIQKAAAKIGFDWPSTDGAWEKLNEEIAEVKELASSDQKHLEAELGDVLFSVVNVARKLKIDPVMAMLNANDKFEKRFRYVEKEMKKYDQNNTEKLSDKEKLDIMESFWQEAKKQNNSDS